MTVINTNVSATLASNAISRNDRAMSTAMERLSTGLRINSAGDDAAGLAIASRMRSRVEVAFSRGRGFILIKRLFEIIIAERADGFKRVF